MLETTRTEKYKTYREMIKKQNEQWQDLFKKLQETKGEYYVYTLYCLLCESINRK